MFIFNEELAFHGVAKRKMIITMAMDLFYKKRKYIYIYTKI